MKRFINNSIIAFFICLLAGISNQVFAQAPNKVSYQAIVRNSSNALVANTLVGMRVRVLQGSASGTPIYTETHTPTSNANGLVNVEIGGGTVVAGDFSTIDWSAGPYFIKTEIDPTGNNSNYTITGTSQLLSVPYALHAKTAESIVGGGGGGGGTTYTVGQFAMGGVVFWIDATGQHGLVAAIRDLWAPAGWGTLTKNTFTTGDGAFAGQMNTALQVALMAPDDASLNFAAKVCANYSEVVAGVEYGDWYLPSKWELNEMYKVKGVINSVSTANSGTAMSFLYWSSTELSDTKVWLQNFDNGVQGNDTRQYAIGVRAIRAF